MEKGSKENLQKIEKVIHVLIDVRNKLRKDKNFQMADQIRDNLKAIGISLTDKPDGTQFEID